MSFQFLKKPKLLPNSQLHEPGPTNWQKNPAEWKRWEDEHWHPDRQKQLLDDILQPVVRKLPWEQTGPQYDEYRSEAAKLAAQNLPDYAFVATRTVLTRDLPAFVTGVTAIGPAYRSVEEIERELGVRSTGALPSLPGAALGKVIAWEFFAPDPDDKRLSDEELLRETVEFVTGDAGFRQRRTAFVEWQQRFLRGGATDRDSIARAVTEVQDLLEDAKKATAKLRLRKIARYAFQIAPVAVSLGLAAAGVPEGLKTAAGAFFFSVFMVATESS